MQKEIKGFRLSPQQKRLWLLSQNDRSCYCAQNAILLEGDVNVERLRQSVQEVVDRHEILRATFHRQSGYRTPIQVIRESSQPAWQKIEISRHNGSQTPLDVKALFRVSREHLFDLENGPLLHLTLVSLDQTRHLLLINLPSLCADAHTLRNLFYEISRAYNASSNAGEQENEPTQYLQFSEWQHALLESEEAAEGNAFWLRQHVNGSFSLPFEKQSSAQTKWDVSGIVIDLEEELVEQIKAAARKHETSLDVWMLACWQTLLWRLTKQQAITVEYLFDGRKYDELQESLGLFANFIPLHCHFDAGLQFREVLRRIESAIQDAEAWQEFWAPNQKEEDDLSNDGRIAFEFIDWAENITAGGVSFSVYQQQVCLNRFNLKLSCSQRGGHLFAELFFDQARFSSLDGQRLVAQFRKLLKSATQHPEVDVESLELIDDDERERLLVEWNNTMQEFPKQRCLHELFESQVERTPDAVAVVYDLQHLSYREMNVRANQLAHYLRKLGVGPEA